VKEKRREKSTEHCSYHPKTGLLWHAHSTYRFSKKKRKESDRS